MFHVKHHATEIKNCPVCGSEAQRLFLECVDFTVSKAVFSIRTCGACGFAFTSPRPADSDLGAYYESEDYISHSNTNKGIVSRLYQTVRKRTLKRKLSLVNTNGKKGAILDIGCGTGEFLGTCKQDGWKALGIEPNPSAREQAQKNHGLEVREEEAMNSLAAKSFDVITLWHVLEHVPGLNERVQKIKELLKDNGLLVVAVPNRNSHDAAYYGKFWAAYDVPRHLWHFRPQDIRQLMEKHGMEVVSVLPMKYDSYYVSMLSEKYRTGSNRMIAAMMRGWISNRKAGKEAWSSQIYLIRHKR